MNFKLFSAGADVKRTSKEGDGALYLATFGLMSSKSPKPDLKVLEDLISAGKCVWYNVCGEGYVTFYASPQSFSFE